MFGTKIRELRQEHGMTQSELADICGVSLRSIQNYESDKLLPRDGRIYTRLAGYFGVSTDYLFGTKRVAAEAEDQPQNEVDSILANVGSLFAGGELSEQDKDEVMRTINDLYWQAKDRKRTKSGSDYRR